MYNGYTEHMSPYSRIHIPQTTAMHERRTASPLPDSTSYTLYPTYPFKISNIPFRSHPLTYPNLHHRQHTTCITHFYKIITTQALQRISLFGNFASGYHRDTAENRFYIRENEISICVCGTPTLFHVKQQPPQSQYIKGTTKDDKRRK